MTCDEFHGLAAEAALDILEPQARADVLAHALSCPACRAELASLSSVADALLLVPSPAEPPAGFESRVLARLDRRAPRRRWWPAVAAAAALLVGVVGGWAAGHHSAQDPLHTAQLLGTSGTPVGVALVHTERDELVCVLDYAPPGAGYGVTVTAGGHEVDLGRVTSDGPGKPWAVDLPAGTDDVRRIVIRDDSGVVRATATF